MTIERNASVQSGAGPAGDRAAASRSARRLLAAAGGLVVIGCLALSIDLPVAAWCKTHRVPGDLGRLVGFAEIFGHTLGAAALLVGTLVLDPALALPWRGARGVAVCRLVAATYAGGLATDVVKLLVARVRPRAADLTALASVAGTFGTGAVAETPGRSDLMSFPSGHAAVAAGLAAALSWRYPRGAVFFTVVAAAAALQRVVSSAHYPSDVAFGAALGLAGAALILGTSSRSGRSMASGAPIC